LLAGGPSEAARAAADKAVGAEGVAGGCVLARVLSADVEDGVAVAACVAGLAQADKVLVGVGRLTSAMLSAGVHLFNLIYGNGGVNVN